MAEKVAKITLSTAQKALQSVVAPDLNEIKATLRVLDTKVDSTNTRITEMDKRLSSKMEDMDKRLTSEIRGVSDKVDYVREIEKLKIEVAELKRRR